MTITEPAPLDQYRLAWVLWACAAIQLTPVTTPHELMVGVMRSDCWLAPSNQTRAFTFVGSLGAITWTHSRSLLAKLTALVVKVVVTSAALPGPATDTFVFEPSTVAVPRVWPARSFTVSVAVRAAGRSERMCVLPAFEPVAVAS